MTEKELFKFVQVYRKNVIRYIELCHDEKWLAASKLLKRKKCDYNKIDCLLAQCQILREILNVLKY